MCRCFPGFNGPNCEFTTRSFKLNDWLWLPPPQQCSSASLSLEFATKETNGLLLYGGPTSPVRNGDVHDFISVELAGGKILVLLSLGDRDDILRVSVTSGTTLNDGEWHHVEVSWNGTVSLELKVKVAIQFPALIFGRVVITTLYHLMLQSWYQKTAQSLVNTLSSFFDTIGYHSNSMTS